MIKTHFMTDLEAKKALLTCPGDTIQETIDYLRMSQVELAERMGRSKEKLNELINGKAPITKETAAKLEYVLGIPANTWMELERQYQEEILSIEKMEFLQSCIDWVKRFPLKKMKELFLLPDTNDKPALVDAMLRFFRVASPTEWNNIYRKSLLAFKIDAKHTAEPEAISVWLRLGEIQSGKVVIKNFDKKQFKERLAEAQTIAFEHPSNWQDQLQSICADCGIALVYTPCITKAPIYGATRWIRNGSLPLIQVTDRQKFNNAFWFTFFHECAHIILHGKKEIFLEGLDNISQDQDKETQADDFAAKLLIKENQLKQILEEEEITTEVIKTYSEKFRIHPGIIVSQLQRHGEISYKDARMNSLKQRVDFSC